MAINPEILIGNHQQDYLKRAINDEKIVEYSIYSTQLLTEGHNRAVEIGWNGSDIIYTWNHGSYHASFIRSVFKRLDPLLEISFTEGDTNGNSDINIHRSWHNSHYDNIDLLDNNPTNGWGGGTTHYDYDNVDIAWKDSYKDDPFTQSEKMTIVHEIGHALGLLDLAYKPEWDTYDSIMSYNHPEDLPIQTWFTDADIKALQIIWGGDAKSNAVQGGNNTVFADGTEDPQYTFAQSALPKDFPGSDSTTLGATSARTSNDTLSINGNGTLTLTPPKDGSGTITLNCEVTDGDGVSTSAPNSIGFDEVPEGIRRNGTTANNKLKGGKGNDTLMGYEGSDKIIGKKGDDLIDAGLHGSRTDKVKGGSGSDTFVIKEGYWIDIKDFNVKEDILDLNGLDNGLSWNHQDGMTFIWGNDGYEVAIFSGYKNLDLANLI
jgi:hypothetical protein